MLKLRRALRERRRSPRAAPGRARPVECSPVPGPAPLRAPLPARAHAACGGRPLAAGGAAPPSASPPSSLHARSGCRVAAAPAPRWRRRSSRRWKVTAAPLPPGPAPGSRGSRPPPSPPHPRGRAVRAAPCGGGRGGTAARAQPGPSVTSAPPGGRGIAVPVRPRGGPSLPLPAPFPSGPSLRPLRSGASLPARCFGRALLSLRTGSPPIPCPRVLGPPRSPRCPSPVGTPTHDRRGHAEPRGAPSPMCTLGRRQHAAASTLAAPPSPGLALRTRPCCCSRSPPALSLLPDSCRPLCVRVLVRGSMCCVQGSVAWPAPGSAGLSAWVSLLQESCFTRRLFSK